MIRQLTAEQNCKIATRQGDFQSTTAAQRAFEKHYGCHISPTRSTIYAILSKFLETGSGLDWTRSGNPATTITGENTELLEPGNVHT